ncbi:outer membrane protein [Ancylobacter lacus]|uniref:outer membrane protein n=1 Tax=Ancylobacter lacus TaxID=2579970 RepID=UPI001BCDA740|nr:outer membrane protein [Ancylobacter lacus]MBS7540287.1 porin family protein [Ancylobacter lacus]
MKKILLASAAFGLLLPVATASAADMAYPVKAAPAPVIVPVFTWTGFYLGANAGYGGGDFDYPYSAYAGPFDASGSIDTNASGFLGGGQIGYNFQLDNNVVVGVEADIMWSGIDGEVSGNTSLYAFDDYVGSLGTKVGSEVEWFGTVRARLGYAWDQLLVYGTGGLAYGSVKSHASLSLQDDSGAQVFSGSLSNDEVEWGWTIGGGLEYALNSNWTFKTEYLYVDLGNQNYSWAGDGAGLSTEVETKFHVVRAGLNYKF